MTEIFILMTRVKRGNVSRKRHKKVLNFTKGFRGAASTLFRTANQQNMKALRYSYENRRKKNVILDAFGLLESMQLFVHMD